MAVSVKKPIKPKPKPKLKQTIVKKEPKVIITYNDMEYKGYIIVIETHGRVIITDRGLHVTEYHTNSIDESIQLAKEYINASI